MPRKNKIFHSFLLFMGLLLELIGFSCGRKANKINKPHDELPNYIGQTIQTLTGCPDIPAFPANVGSKAQIEKWNLQVKSIIDCLREANVSYDKFETISNLIEEKQKELKALQDAYLAEKLGLLTEAKKNYINETKDKILEIGEAARGPLAVELANERQKVFVLNRIINVYELRLKKKQAEYARLVKDYLKYKNTELAVYNQLEDIAQRAASTDVNVLSNLKGELVLLSRNELQLPQILLIDLRSLIRQINYDLEDIEGQLEPFLDFMSKQGIERPNLKTQSLDALKKMVAYCELRMGSVFKAINKMLENINLREDALIASTAEQQVKEEIAEVTTVMAAANFLNQITEKKKELWESPSKSIKLKLMYFSEKYGKMISFKQLEKLCQPSLVKSTWLEDGCNSINAEIKKVHNYLNIVMPNLIKFDILTLRQAQVNEEMLQKIEDALNNDNLSIAVHTHDLAVTVSEGE